MTVLAQQAGISQQMVSYIERGMRNPSIDTLLRIADVLEVDFSEVMRQAIRK